MNTPQQSLTFTANIVLIAVGLTLLCIGIYGIFPSPFLKIMSRNKGLLIMLAVFALIMACSYRTGGASDALSECLKRASQFIPLMVLLCIVMGLGTVLTRWYQAEILRHIGNWGVWPWLVGGLTTPTTNSFIPVVESAWSLEQVRPYCICFQQASALMSIPLFTLRITGFATGSPIPLRMYIFGCMVALLMFVFAKPLYVVTDTIARQFERPVRVQTVSPAAEKQ